MKNYTQDTLNAVGLMFLILLVILGVVKLSIALGAPWWFLFALLAVWLGIKMDE